MYEYLQDPGVSRFYYHDACDRYDVAAFAGELPALAARDRLLLEQASLTEFAHSVSSLVDMGREMFSCLSEEISAEYAAIEKLQNRRMRLFSFAESLELARGEPGAFEEFLWDGEKETGKSYELQKGDNSRRAIISRIREELDQPCHAENAHRSGIAYHRELGRDLLESFSLYLEVVSDAALRARPKEFFAPRLGDNGPRRGDQLSDKVLAFREKRWRKAIEGRTLSALQALLEAAEEIDISIGDKNCSLRQTGARYFQQQVLRVFHAQDIASSGGEVSA